MDKSADRFREVFLEEAKEHLESMEASLLNLEADGTADAATLNGIFRSAHTIKGGSGMFGLDDMARFTHALENLLDQVRSGKIPVTPPLVDVLLRSCDVLRSLLAAARLNAPPPSEMEKVLADLQEANAAAPTPAQANAPQAAVQNRTRVWKIVLRPAGDIFRRGVDPLIAFRELAQLGRVSNLALDSSKVPALHAMDPGENYLAWTLTFESDQPEEKIREVFDFLHDGEGLDMHVESPQDVSNSGASAHPPITQPPVNDVSRSAAENTIPPAVSASGDSSSTIRVDVDLLDRLMNQVGELVLARNQILQFSNAADSAALTAASQRLNLITSELQEGVMKTRMQPIGVAWSMIPRLVRDLAHACGKQIQLEMEGSETELDRTIIDAIKDPLTHLVRNACDHGLEAPPQRELRGKGIAGTLLLRAFHEGGHVIIEIADDGGGIDIAKVKNKALERRLITPEQAARMSEREAANLIFLPGFSTAERVSNISGRGVGMDVVKTNIERIGGTVDVSSRPGHGTTVRIKIPLTLAIIPGMVVESFGERFVIPQVSLVELVRLEEDQARERIEKIHGAPVCRLRGKLLPLVHLSEILGGRTGDHGGDAAVSIVVLQAEDRQFGLVVDGIRDTQEIVVKPLGKQLKGLVAYSGATVMGDGRVALILDVPGLAQLSGFGTGGYASETRSAASTEVESRNADQQAMLLFRSPGYERMAVPLAMVARLEEFPLKRLEKSGGHCVVQYRERILPLISLQEGGDVAIPSGGDPDDLLQVIVFAEGDRGAGLVVTEILDIVEENIRVRKANRRRGGLGSAVIGGQVTDLLDLEYVMDAAGEGWWKAESLDRRATILIGGASAITRAMVRAAVEMSGYRVLEASNAREVIDSMTKHSIDAIALSSDLQQAEGEGSLLALIRSQAGRKIPVLSLAGPQQNDSEFDAYTEKLSSVDVTRSLEALLARS